MREFIRITDTAIPGGKDLIVNIDAVDCLMADGDHTEVTLRCGRVVRAPQTISELEAYFPETER